MNGYETNLTLQSKPAQKHSRLMNYRNKFTGKKFIIDKEGKKIKKQKQTRNKSVEH